MASSEMTEIISIKKPKRVLHFSDGVLEEFSDDEEVTPTLPQDTTPVDYKSLTWGPWLSYKAWAAGSSALAACDYLGENLAYFFGITTPKYWYEIEEYKRMEAAKLEKLKKAEGWSEPNASATNDTPLTNNTEPVTEV